MQSSGGMATVEAATRAAGEPADVRAGRRPDRRDLGGPDGGPRERRHARHGRHLRRHRRRRRRPAARCATCSTRRSATTRRWCRWSTSTRSARAEARSPTWTRAASSASARSRRAPIPGRPATAAAATSPPRRTRSSCSGGCGRTEACSAATCRSTSSSRPRRWSSVADRLGVPVEEAALGALQIQKFGDGAGDRGQLASAAATTRASSRSSRPAARARCSRATSRSSSRSRASWCPPHPGITSATGLLATDLQHEFVATERHALKSLDRDRLGSPLRRARCAGGRAARARTASRRTGASCGASPTAATWVRATRSASTFPPASSTTAGQDRLADAFHAAHEREYGHRFDAEVEIVNVRALGIGLIPELQWAELEAGDGDPARAKTVEREVVFDVEGQSGAPRDALLRSGAAAGGRPDRGAGDRRAVRLDDRDPARASSPRSTAPGTS